jgi:DNA helicase-2/ATP-dependent DNA helicase PcrA
MIVPESAMDAIPPIPDSAQPSRPGAAKDVFSDLNERQRDAVEHGLAEGALAGPLLVIAGAGTGKTKTLASRVARLVQTGADPHRILLLTFARRAAREMEHRVGRLLHRLLGFSSTQAPPHFPWCGTFHSVGARLLRDYAERINLAPNFTILDRSDAEDLMGMVRQELGLAETVERFPQKASCLAIYSRVVNSQSRLDQVLQTHYPWCFESHDGLKRMFKAYAEAKLQQQVLDYDDLLLYWVHMMADDGIAADVRSRFDHVLIDEYQDTNRLQGAIVLGLKPRGENLTVVGDDAQAIYSFRAADVRNILDFPEQFDPPARIVALEQNYRSTQPILAASNAVIGLAKKRHAKDLWSDRPSSELPRITTLSDEADQARWVADEVLRRREEGIRLIKQAVLFRTSNHSAPLELELTRRNIPFRKFGGLKFLETSHVKDVLSILRWAQNPRARLAGFRVSQLLPGFGPVTAGRLLDEMELRPDPLTAIEGFTPPKAAADDWAKLAGLVGELCRTSEWPADLERAIEWYQPHLERMHDDAEVRLADLEQIARIAQGYASRERFLTELTLDPPEASSDESGAPHLDEDYLILSTIHSAKGQEWNAVYLLNAVDGCMPSDMATGRDEDIEEERRLLYVAMTRAKHHLALITPQRFYVRQQRRGGDTHIHATLTRFIPGKVARLFERVDPSPSRDKAAAAAPAAGPVVDVSARLRAMWD